MHVPVSVQVVRYKAFDESRRNLAFYEESKCHLYAMNLMECCGSALFFGTESLGRPQRECTGHNAHDDAFGHTRAHTVPLVDSVAHVRWLRIAATVAAAAAADKKWALESFSHFQKTMWKNNSLLFMNGRMEDWSQIFATLTLSIFHMWLLISPGTKFICLFALGLFFI